jgi:hypothetical protein
MKTLAPLSTMGVPRSPERRVLIGRKMKVELNRREVIRENWGEMIRVARGAKLSKRWIFEVPRGVEATVTLEVLVERGASFGGEVVVQGEGTLRLKRILRVLGGQASATWMMRGAAGARARIFEDSWVFVRGVAIEANMRTRLVLEDEASFTGRHIVQSQSRMTTGRLESQLDILRLSEQTRATVVPEVGEVPANLLISHGGRVAGLEEGRAEYLQGRGLELETVKGVLKQAFLYG